jgi:hypothetical protein
MDGRFCVLEHVFTNLAPVFYEANQGDRRSITTSGIAKFQGPRADV